MPATINSYDAKVHATLCADNIKAYWADRGYKVNVEVVPCGSGHHMRGHYITKITDKFNRKGYRPFLTNTFNSSSRIKAMMRDDLNNYKMETIRAR